MIKNILITGCNGQLGNEMQLQAKLYNQYNFIFTDIDELDITDSEKINKFVDDNSIDCIVNCIFELNSKRCNNWIICI